MRKIMDRRTATTLIELLVVLIMMGFFITMVFHLFGVTYSAYNFNRELAAKSYAQANVDNFFEIFEKELMYAGSLGGVIKKLNDPQFKDNNPINIETSTITVQYALAEQIILTKKDKEKYTNIQPPATYSTETTFFSLYPASIPNTLSDRWVLTYDDIQPTNESSLISIDNIATSTVSVKISVSNAVNATMFEITSSSTPATYVSILLREKSFDTLNSTQILLNSGDSEKWNGEMLYKTIIALKAPAHTNETTKLTVKKYIPTIDSEYEIALMDNIYDFKATETGDLYVATVTYLIPGIYRGYIKKDIDDATVTVTRKFFKQ